MDSYVSSSATSTYSKASFIFIFITPIRFYSYIWIVCWISSNLFTTSSSNSSWILVIYLAKSWFSETMFCIMVFIIRTSPYSKSLLIFLVACSKRSIMSFSLSSILSSVRFLISSIYSLPLWCYMGPKSRLSSSSDLLFLPFLLCEKRARSILSSLNFFCLLRVLMWFPWLSVSSTETVSSDDSWLIILPYPFLKGSSRYSLAYRLRRAL